MGKSDSREHGDGRAHERCLRLYYENQCKWLVDDSVFL